MSLARDDVGITGALNALKAEFVKSGTLEKQGESRKNSDAEKENPEINDVFEKDSSKEAKKDPNRVEKLQEEYNSIEIKKQALDKVDKNLSELQETGETPDEAELRELKKAIEETPPLESSTTEQEAKNEAIKDQQEQTSEQQNQNRDSAEQQGDSAKRVNELRAMVSEKQQQLVELQQKLYHEVNSTVELRIGSNNESTESEEKLAQELKDSVVKDIQENPEQARKIQITNLDKNLILAMLSLRQ